MRTIQIIHEQDIIPDAPHTDPAKFVHRRAARAVVIDDRGRIALLHVTNGSYHKLPGGGIEEGEDIPTALGREVREETGCRAEVDAEVGQIIEYRDQWEQIQTSYCYLARQRGSIGQPEFTEDEKAHGFEIVWAANIDTAIAMVAADRPTGYDGKRIQPRDLAFLRAARSHIVG